MIGSLAGIHLAGKTSWIKKIYWERDEDNKLRLSGSLG
jgi:hypothetical protein